MNGKPSTMGSGNQDSSGNLYYSCYGFSEIGAADYVSANWPYTKLDEAKTIQVCCSYWDTSKPMPYLKDYEICQTTTLNALCTY